MKTFKSLPRASVSATLLALGFVSAATAKVECRQGMMVDDATGKPVIDQTTGKIVHCDFKALAEQDTSVSTATLVVGGAVIAGAGVGIAAAAGAFKGSPTQSFVPALPLSNQ